MGSIFLPFLLLVLTSQSPSDTIRHHYEAAESKRRAGNLVAAETEYAAILGESYERLGKIYTAQKAHKEAIAALEAAAVYASDPQDVLLDLAIAYFNAEQFEKAVPPLAKALARDPKNAGAHHMMGKTYFMLGELRKSVDELELALRITPNDYDASYTLGLAYLKQRQLAPAKRIYDQMITQLGDRPQLRVLFGRSYRETGFLAEAVGEFKRAVALDSHFPRVHYYLGLTSLLKDGPAALGAAAEEFRIELASHPEEFFANYYLGIIYVIERKWDVAITSLENAARIQANNPDPYFFLGEAYQAIGKHDQAIEVLRKSIANSPSLDHNDYQVATAHYRLGQSLRKTGKTEEGEKELQISLALKSEGHKRDEEKTATYLNSSTLHQQNGNFPEILSVEGIVAESNAPDQKTTAELKNGEAYYVKVVASAHTISECCGQSDRSLREQRSNSHRPPGEPTTRRH
jgi:tetratricopeptide (TPR) repeat protein